MERMRGDRVYILFISDPYVERTFFSAFEKYEKFEFVFLEQNHPEMRYLQNSNVHLLKFDEALDLCDCIYIYPGLTVSQKLIQKCKKYAEAKGIEIHIHDISGKYTQTINDVLSAVQVDIANYVMPLPTILILQVGKMVQIEKAELDLCQALNNNHINYHLCTTSISSELNSMMNRLGTPWVSHEDQRGTDILIVSLCIDIMDTIINDAESIMLYDIICKIQPDYIIACCEYDYTHVEKLKDSIGVKYNIVIDSFFKSEYVSLQTNGEQEFSLFMGELFNADLFQDVRRKLSFPEGVKEIPLITK